MNSAGPIVPAPVGICLLWKAPLPGLRSGHLDLLLIERTDMPLRIEAERIPLERLPHLMTVRVDSVELLAGVILELIHLAI